MAEATMVGAELDTLAVSMVANVQNFQANMAKTMEILKQFCAGIKVSTTFQDLGKETGMVEERLQIGKPNASPNDDK